MTFSIRLAVVAAGFLFVPVQAVAQTDNPAWLEQLEEQIATEKECEVGFYILINEEKLVGRVIQEARVQCVDGRQFDATRSEPDAKFTINECGTRVC